MYIYIHIGMYTCVCTYIYTRTYRCIHIYVYRIIVYFYVEICMVMTTDQGKLFLPVAAAEGLLSGKWQLIGSEVLSCIKALGIPSL